jgi:hypothetical protein
MALWIAFVALLPLLAAFKVSAQIVVTPKEPGRNVSGTVTVNVSDLPGAAIQNAFLLFRADRLGISNAKPFQLEWRTSAAGRAMASVPCGYVAVNVATVSPVNVPQ